ncbi:Na+/H+ antiporter NhaA [Patulibacter defluvii]|uniref:Na+/H+ antiporter NhaA n=1 Tax=Patulibacter defluvii TaxID=3095358 RepID=UPI002A75C0AC|nr:Na+/H+ antiporter NhaA [Patulibacter sp. DM4]
MSTAALAAGKTAWARNLAAPIRRYLHAEIGGSLILVAAIAAALVWANVAPGSYERLWETSASIAVGDHRLETDLRGWINEGLMTLFFLVVGLEAKRELDVGELRERSRMALPAVAAIGGMLAAAAAYLAINAGGSGASGWGAAVSTDTALALGALALVTRGRGLRARVFLLSMVVSDDLIALLIIALAYTETVSPGALAVALGLFALLIALRFLSVAWRAPVAVVVGFGVWLAMFESGVDPVIAGLAIGLVTTAYPPARDDLERSTELARSFREQPSPEAASSVRAGMNAAISANERLQYLLHPWTSRVVVPLFALANAGVHLDGELLSRAVASPITIGLLVAFVVAKPLGVLAATWVASRPFFGGARPTLTWPALAITAASAGVGFTVSLLVASLAFDGPRLEEAKVGVLLTALLSPLVATLGVRILRRLPEEVRARQLEATAPPIADLADEVDPATDHVRGTLDAPLTLLEYGDLECPYCRDAWTVVERLQEQFGDQLRYVFRHLPLSDVHPGAQLAAEASEAAAAQGAFWEMHERLLHDDDGLSGRDLLRHAAELGLDVERFADDLRRRRHAPRVARDVQSADASGVSGTPTFFVNGRRHQGAYDHEALATALRAAALRATAGR